MGVCSKSGGERSTPRLSRPLRRQLGTERPSRSNAWPTMPCGGRCETGPSRTCGRQGEKAQARSAHREAVGYFEQALSVLPHLPETREQAIDLRLALSSALNSSGDFGPPMAYLREAKALVAALDDPRRLAQVSLFLSRRFILMGAYDQVIAAAQNTLALLAPDGDVILHALANRYLGLAYQA